MTPQTQATTGRLWWLADDPKELAEWKAEFDTKGIRIISTEPVPFTTQINVVIELERNQAQSLLDYTPDPEEWLTKETP